MPATAPRWCRRRIVDKLQVHRRPSGKSHLFCLCHLADSCSHKNFRRRRAVDILFVAVVTAADRESWIQFNFYYLTPTVLQSRRRICVASATYVHICRKALATISQTRRRHDCVICEPSFRFSVGWMLSNEDCPESHVDVATHILYWIYGISNCLVVCIRVQYSHFDATSCETTLIFHIREYKTLGRDAFEKMSTLLAHLGPPDQQKFVADRK